jgi:hypothetical protein
MPTPQLNITSNRDHDGRRIMPAAVAMLMASPRLNTVAHPFTQIKIKP